VSCIELRPGLDAPGRGFENWFTGYGKGEIGAFRIAGTLAAAKSPVGLK